MPDKKRILPRIKSSIAWQLGVSFAAALLVFSLAVSVIFTALFKDYTLDIYRAQLQHSARAVAQSLSGHHMGMMLNFYLHCIGDITNADIWIVDAEKNFIAPSSSMGHGMMHGRMPRRSTDLPPDAGKAVDDVLAGQEVFSEGFSSVFSETSLTAAVPITDSRGQVQGAVLLHAPVSGMTQTINRGLMILAASVGAALLIVLLLASALSYILTRPLLRMKETALQLAGGNYKAKCCLKRQDEIGDLANALDLLAQRLDEAKRRSDALDKLRRDFTANVSHELRTPVTVIRGSLEALKDGIVSEPDKVDQYYSQMLSEAKFLERLIGDLLELSRLQNPDFPIEMSTVAVKDVLHDALRSARAIAAAKQIRLQADIDDFNITMQGDYSRLRQMLLIVLDNAVKFSPDGAAVEITAGQDTVTIRDHGPGIAPELSEHIFDRFYKSRDERNKKGTGLGLAIARQIAGRHGISIKAANAPGGGACFYFYFH